MFIQILVSRSFRSFLLNTYPYLTSHPSYLRLFQSILFPFHINKQSFPIIDRSTLFLCWNGKGGKHDGHFKGEDQLLKPFRDDVLRSLKWSDPKRDQAVVRIPLHRDHPFHGIVISRSTAS